MVLTKIALTGATGMLGRHIRAAFGAADINVIAVSRKTSTESNIACWELSQWLLDTEFDDLFEGAQAVVHVGANVPRFPKQVDEASVYDANVRACTNIGLWAVKRDVPIIYVSGAIVYSDQTACFQHESSELGWNDLGGFYGFSKKSFNSA